MLKLTNDKELPEVFATIEKRIDKSVPEFLGFGQIDKLLQSLTEEDGNTLIGDLNEKNKLHGRGLKITPYGFIQIGYFYNGECTTGNYISIRSDGTFSVGEYYNDLEEGELKIRGCQFNTDGTREEYDL